jgi:hypothetical protein
MHLVTGNAPLSRRRWTWPATAAAPRRRLRPSPSSRTASRTLSPSPWSSPCCSDTLSVVIGSTGAASRARRRSWVCRPTSSTRCLLRRISPLLATRVSNVHMTAAEQGTAPRGGPPPLAASVLRRVRSCRRLARDDLALRDARRDGREPRQQTIKGGGRGAKVMAMARWWLNRPRVYLLGLLSDAFSTHSTVLRTKEESMVQTRKTRTQNAARPRRATGGKPSR